MKVKLIKLGVNKNIISWENDKRLCQEKNKGCIKIE